MLSKILIKQNTVFVYFIILFFFNNCNNKSIDYTYKMDIDSFPRLKEGSASLPRSSYNPKFSLVCYYSKVLNKIFYHTSKEKGSFNTPSHLELITYYPHNIDTIFLIYDDSILLVNSKGTIYKTIKYLNIIKYKNVSYAVCKTHLVPPTLAYDSYRNILYLPCHNYQSSFWKKDFYQNSMLLIGIDIKKNTLKYFNTIKYPDEYLTKSYGQLYEFYYTLKDNEKMYMSFMALRNVFQFSLYKPKQNISVIELPKLKEVPEYDTSLNENYNMVFEYVKRVNVYSRIIYDPYRNLFYRLYTQPTINSQQIKKSFASNLDVILITYDIDFKEIKCFNFGDSVNQTSAFVSNRGLHLKMYKPSANYEYFKIVSISN